MKKFALIVVTLVCAFTLLVAVSFAGGPMKSESGWFDFENCVFCKNLTENPGLMEHSTWENHSIKNGSMNIMVVDHEYAEAMAEAEKKMAALGQKISNGEVNPRSMKMCGHCMNYGMIMMGGVQMERVNGDAAIITLMTSDDPTMVKRLHAQVKRDTEEMAEIMAHSH